MSKMVCCRCGNKIETIPVHCGQDMIFNDNTLQWECWMGPNCGYVKLDEIMCEKCAESEC